MLLAILAYLSPHAMRMRSLVAGAKSVRGAVEGPATWSARAAATYREVPRRFREGSGKAHPLLEQAAAAALRIARKVAAPRKKGGSPTALDEWTATLLSTPDMRRTCSSRGVSLKLGSLYVPGPREWSPPMMYRLMVKQECLARAGPAKVEPAERLHPPVRVVAPEELLGGRPAHALGEAALDLPDVERGVDGRADVDEQVDAPHLVAASV